MPVMNFFLGFEESTLQGCPINLLGRFHPNFANLRIVLRLWTGDRSFDFQQPLALYLLLATIQRHG